MDYYFNQLMEIQNSTDHSFFLLDQDSEPRFVIEADKRTIIIPAEFQFLGVKTDQRSEKIYFEVDRIFDDVDLSTKTCVIQYINAGTDDVDEGIYPVTELDTTTVPGKIVFKWEVDNIVCKYAGVVAFSVRFYEIDPETKLYTYCWNTIPESLPVLDGLNVSGSVTEDFPTELLEWNARMAALNTEITNKISAADATMKADLKTAKGYMDGAQAARGGAEEAESRVKKIVAGNEAYTKAESDNVYAKSQVKESERGTSVEVYPEDCSNLAVTAYGFTEQAGSGDSSPNNVRAITNCGVDNYFVPEMLTSGVLWNSSSKTLTKPSTPELYYYDIFNGTTGANTIAENYIQLLPNTKYVFSAGKCDTATEVFSVGKDGSVSKLTTGLSENSIEAETNDVGRITIRMYASGTSKATDIKIRRKDSSELFSYFVTNGKTRKAVFSSLTSPLCNEDSVISWVKSGCDKVVTFDGSEDEGWVADSASGTGPSGSKRMYAKLSFNVPNSDGTVKSAAYFNYLINVTNGSFFEGQQDNVGSVMQSQTLSSGAVYVRIAGISTVEALQKYLASNPLTVWYRSTSYTESEDIPVSLETHMRWSLTLDGTSPFVAAETNQSGKNRFRWLVTPSAYKTDVSQVANIYCSHYKAVQSGSANGGTYGATGYGISVDNYGNIFIYDSDHNTTAEDFKAYLAAQASAGTPVTIVYRLATPLVYAHPAVDIISNINESGSIVVSGQKEVSISYHKSLNKTIIELDNKSYSKQESHNIFARALRGTAEAAKSIAIHPDAGSNVKVTVNGFTKQEGEGDASPENVRPIMSGGMQANLFPGFTQLAYRDTSTGEVVPNNNGNVTSDVFPCKRNQDYYVSVKRSVNSSLAVWFWDSDGALLQKLTVSDGQVDPSGSFKSPVNAVKMAISAYSAGGTLENYTNQLLAYGKDAVPYTEYTGNEYAVALEWHGENILPKNKSSASTQTGVTFTPNDDGTIAVKGTATADADYYTFGSYSSYDVKFILSPGEYYLSGNKEASGVVLYLLSRTKSGVKNIASANTTAGTKFTVDVYTPVTAFLVRAVKGQTVNGIVKPMLNVGATASPYKQGSEILRAPIVLAAPLCQGDKFITNVKSGCDKVVVLNGSENWVIAASGTANKRFGLSGGAPNAVGGIGTYISDTFITSYTASAAQQSFSYVAIYSGGYIDANIPGVETVEDFKAYLSTNPLTIWYRSTNYTESDDIAVSLEKHNRWIEDLDGTETWYENEGSKWCYTNSNTVLPKSTNGTVVCSHFKGRESTSYIDTNWITVSTSGYVVIKSDEYVSDKDALIQALAAMNANGEPVRLEYELATPVVYAHEPVDFIANLDESGVLVITGEADGTVSAEYNKDITYAFNELQSAVLAAIASLSL